MQCITIHPYFQVEEGKLDEFKAIWKEITPTVQTEAKCSFYEFSFNGHVAFCREGYDDAEGVLAHLANVGASLEKVLSHFLNKQRRSINKVLLG